MNVTGGSFGVWDECYQFDNAASTRPQIGAAAA
jgi:hypothetical protein